MLYSKISVRKSMIPINTTRAVSDIDKMQVFTSSNEFSVIDIGFTNMKNLAHIKRLNPTQLEMKQTLQKTVNSC